MRQPPQIPPEAVEHRPLTESEQQRLREYLAEQDRLCPSCGYNLRGSTDTKCPECGAPFTMALLGPDVSFGETVRKLGPAGVLAVLWSVAPALCGFLLLGNIAALSDWLKIDPTYGLLGYIAVFMVSAGLGLLPTYAQAILGGWVFGFAWGFPAALAGFAGGSLIGYFVARTVSKERVQKVIDQKPTWRAVREALVGQGFWKTFLLVSLVRLPPNSPFAVTNLLLSTTGVKLLPYTLGTMVGMAPRTGLAVGLAAAGAATGAKDIQTFVTESKGNLWLIIGGFVVFFVVLGIIGYLANKAIAKVTAGQAAAVPTTET
ncbi:MAG: VTT domain-containing protein [Pyrinomonadaceae bacterium]|nr:VTT domain-containing protein [Phycisphaerales bacterium]